MARLYNNKHAVTDSIIKLYTDASIMEMRAFNDRIDDSHPKYKEILYIYCIAEVGEKCTATDICKLFNVSKAMASQTLNAMERKGFITREKDPDDHRRHFIRISQEKIDMITAEMALIDDCVDKISEKYSAEEIEIAAKVLTDVASNIRVTEPVFSKPVKK